MLITKPTIMSPTWTNKGVYIHVHGYLYVRAESEPFKRGAAVDGEDPVLVQVQLLGRGADPDISVNHELFDHIPGAMGAVEDWIAVHELVDVWRQEVPAYEQVVGHIHLPFEDVPAGEIQRVCYRKVAIATPPGMKSLVAEVLVHKSEVEIQIQLLCDEIEGMYGSLVPCPIYTYPIELPLTVDKVKASVRGPLQQYLCAIDTPKANGGLHLKPDHDIDWVRWDSNGITISLGLDIHKGNESVGTYIWIVGKDSPQVVVPPTGRPERYHWIDEAMPLIHELIAERGLMAVWEREAAAYRKVMQQVDMGDLVPLGGHSIGGAPYLLYLVSMTAPGATDLELRVKVHKGGRVEAVLHVVNDALPVGASTPNTYCDLCTYEVALPITLDGLKGMVVATLQEYMNAIWMGSKV